MKVYKVSTSYAKCLDGKLIINIECADITKRTEKTITALGTRISIKNMGKLCGSDCYTYMFNCCENIAMAKLLFLNLLVERREQNIKFFEECIEKEHTFVEGLKTLGVAIWHSNRIEEENQNG